MAPPGQPRCYELPEHNGGDGWEETQRPLSNPALLANLIHPLETGVQNFTVIIHCQYFSIFPGTEAPAWTVYN